MLQIELMTMQEYKPINGDTVDIYLLDRAFPEMTGINLCLARCEVTYQMYDAEDRSPCPSWTSNTDELMEKIPFNTPFAHITDEENKLTGFRLLDEADLVEMSDQGTDSIYWEKRWFFNLGNHKQIHDTDQDNEVLGIMDKHKLAAQLLG